MPALFSRGHATLLLAVSVSLSVRQSRNIFELQAVFALLLLTYRPRQDCRVSGLVAIFLGSNFFSITFLGSGPGGADDL